MLGCGLMIPKVGENGNLPLGVHFCEWEEFVERFGTTPRRLKLIDGLKKAMEQLKEAGCPMIYIDGSFVTINKILEILMRAGKTMELMLAI